MNRIATFLLILLAALPALAQTTKPAVNPTPDLLRLREMFTARDGESKVLRNKGWAWDPNWLVWMPAAWQINDTIEVTASDATFVVNSAVYIDWKGPADRPAILVKGTTNTTIGGPGPLRVACRSDFPLDSGLVIQNRPLADMRDGRVCASNTLRNILITSSDWGGLVRDGFRIERAPGPWDPKGDVNNSEHTFQGVRSMNPGRAGFFLADGCTQAMNITIDSCAFTNAQPTPETFTPYGVCVMSGQVRIYRTLFSRNKLDVFLLRVNRPMVVEDFMSENSLRCFDTGRAPPELQQRIRFSGGFWSEHMAKGGEVFTYRMGGRGHCEVDVQFSTPNPSIRAIVRGEQRGAIRVHDSTNADVCDGGLSSVPIMLDESEKLPF